MQKTAEKTNKIPKNQKKSKNNSETFGSRPKSNEKDISARMVDRITRQRTFEANLRPQIGSEFFIFKRRGDQIEGTIGRPIVNYQRSQSYPMKLDDGRVVEFFANKLLHRLIEKNELYFSRVRVVYVGRQYTSYGKHSRKIYRVYKQDGDKQAADYMKKLHEILKERKN